MWALGVCLLAGTAVNVASAAATAGTGRPGVGGPLIAFALYLVLFGWLVVRASQSAWLLLLVIAGMTALLQVVALAALLAVPEARGAAASQLLGGAFAVASLVLLLVTRTRRWANR